MIEHQRPLLPQSSFVIRRSPMVGNMAQQSHSSCVGKYVFCDPSNLQHVNDHSSKARLPVWVKADLTAPKSNFRFSNRPVEVKHFQAIHGCSVDVSHGLALLFGIGTKALPLWDSRTRRNNLYRGLAVSVTAGSSGSTNSPHPSSREGHLFHRSVDL